MRSVGVPGKLGFLVTVVGMSPEEFCNMPKFPPASGPGEGASYGAHGAAACEAEPGETAVPPWSAQDASSDGRVGEYDTLPPPGEPAEWHAGMHLYGFVHPSY